MSVRIGVARRNGFFIPRVEREQELTIDQITHIYCTVGFVILYVIELVKKPASIRLRDSRLPALVPDLFGEAQRLIARIADRLRFVERLVHGRDGRLRFSIA